MKNPFGRPHAPGNLLNSSLCMVSLLKSLMHINGSCWNVLKIIAVFACEISSQVLTLDYFIKGLVEVTYNNCLSSHVLVIHWWAEPRLSVVPSITSVL